jgi:hypothetical protein
MRTIVFAEALEYILFAPPSFRSCLQLPPTGGNGPDASRARGRDAGDKRTSEYRTIDLRVIFFAFSGLDRAVDASIGASAARGKMPGRGWKFPEDGAWRLPLL